MRAVLPARGEQFADRGAGNSGRMGFILGLIVGAILVVVLLLWLVFDLIF